MRLGVYFLSWYWLRPVKTLCMLPISVNSYAPVLMCVKGLVSLVSFNPLGFFSLSPFSSADLSPKAKDLMETFHLRLSVLGVQSLY